MNEHRWLTIVGLALMLGACTNPAEPPLETGVAVVSESSDEPDILPEDVETSDATFDVELSGHDAFVPSPDVADMADAADTGGAVDVGPEVEEVQVEVSPPPTWWTCRRAKVGGTLTDVLEAACDARYLAAPEVRHYGLRVVSLVPAFGLSTWLAPRLEVLNTLFAPAGMSFEVTSTVVIEGSPISDLALDPPRSFEALTADTAQHLGLASDDVAEVHAALEARLSAEGVVPQALEAMTVETVVPVRNYLGTMARANPEEIYVVVAPAINGQQTSGMSSGPGFNPTSPSIPIVNLRADDDVDVIVLAHEMGHYFGLKHPHAKVQESTVQVPYLYEAVIANPPIDIDVTAALTAHFGPELDGPLGEPYPAYSAPMNPVLQTFDATRAVVSLLWLSVGHTYRFSPEGPMPFDGLADFIAAGDDGESIFYKNVTWPGGNNCGLDAATDQMMCTLATPYDETVMVPGDDPLLDGTITLGGGQKVNLMTYIAKTFPEGGTAKNTAFTPHAIQVLKLTANAPVRQLVRNLAL